ncbi:alpha/beta hydrolase [uncultured Alistipes sp.]|jgi:alpha/beta hydrolase fold-3 domain protein|uniref:alpha/beta hydrolase n=1 Tax=uncultured Alistipes sp. TaxID=538949 RepID=UPI0025EAB1DD|nr:alpha/beta hydrolase [uncultured Alistipes sp.]
MKNVKKSPHYLEDTHLSGKTREFLKALNASKTPVESLPVKEARGVLSSAQASVKVDVSGIEEMEKTISADGHTIKLIVVRPQGVKEELPAFMFIHGGGWVLGDYPTHKRLIRDLVVESGFAAVYVDYSRSPEAKFPVAVEEVYAATKWVAENGSQINVDGTKLAVVGNSAGGNMSTVTSIKAKENKGPVIKAQVLMWPVTDAGTDFESFDLYGEERFLTTSLLKWMAGQYISREEDADSIYLSALRAPLEKLKGLPPTLIETAENDILRDQGEEFGRRLDQAGVDATTVRFNNVIHDWGMLNGCAELPETKALIMLSAAFLKKHLQ